MRNAITFALLVGLTAFPAKADEVTKWNETATRAAFISGLSNNPLFEVRVYTITQLAVHDALNSINRRYLPYAFHGTAPATASPQAAVAAAAFHVLTDQFKQLVPFGFPSPQSILNAALASSLASIPNGPSKDAGIAAGKKAANAILALRAGDGWNQQTLQDFAYPQGTAPGQYRFAPPNNFAFLTRWHHLRPFAIFRADQFRVGPPYPINSQLYTKDYNEIKALGGNGTTTPSARTPDQTEIARFWYESSPLGWNRIARTVTLAKGTGLWENARLFGLLNLAMCDGYIANWDTKYYYNYWRPITAIRLGNTDGNPDTVGDPGWTPLLDTPPVPDYSSGHSLEGGAAAEIMKHFFRTDHVSFSTCSTTMLPGKNCGEGSQVVRSFTSLTQAAHENAVSRILVGIHFRKAILEGVEQGRKLAQFVFVHQLQPLSGH